MEKAAIICKDVVKNYGNAGVVQKAIRGITIDFYKGELAIIMGPSGCGKTTFLSIISSILTEDSGVVEVFGKNFHQMSSEEKSTFRSEKVGFLFQNYFLMPALTVVENVELPLLIQEKTRHEARFQAERILKYIGIEDLTHRWPSELSSGQQQRVAFARAIIHKPNLIICDEPTSALDKDNGMIMMDLLKNHAVKQDNAVIVATHDQRILPFADRIVMMSDGLIEDVINMAGQKK